MKTDDRIALTTMDDGKVVSTVRLPFPHRGGRYETMVFPEPGKWDELDLARYATAEEAERGHAAMVAKWQVGTPEEVTTLFDGDDPVGELADAIKLLVGQVRP